MGEDAMWNYNIKEKYVLIYTHDYMCECMDNKKMYIIHISTWTKKRDQLTKCGANVSMLYNL